MPFGLEVTFWSLLTRWLRRLEDYTTVGTTVDLKIGSPVPFFQTIWTLIFTQAKLHGLDQYQTLAAVQFTTVVFVIRV